MPFGQQHRFIPLPKIDKSKNRQDPPRGPLPAQHGVGFDHDFGPGGRAIQPNKR
jgi:hypothetical protein